MPCPAGAAGLVRAVMECAVARSTLWTERGAWHRPGREGDTEAAGGGRGRRREAGRNGRHAYQRRQRPSGALGARAGAELWACRLHRRLGGEAAAARQRPAAHGDPQGVHAVWVATVTKPPATGVGLLGAGWLLAVWQLASTERTACQKGPAGADAAAPSTELPATGRTLETLDLLGRTVAALVFYRRKTIEVGR